MHSSTILAMMANHAVTMYFDEEGCSSYSNRNIYATEVQKLELEFIRQFFNDQACTLKKSEGPFTVADFGTADGGGFIKILPDIVDIIRFHCGQDKQVSVVFEDDPENDFKSVFKTFSGIWSADNDSEQMTQLKEVFFSASGTSFYRQCLPDNTLSLACSSTALHNLSVRPCVIDHCFHWIYDNKDSHLFEKQGAEDLETFLLHRAKEMKTGALMVLFIVAMDDEGRYTGYTRAGNILKTITGTWIELFKRGIITKEEIRQSTFAEVARKKKDIMKPFEREGSAVIASGLRLYGIEKVILQSPTYEELLKSYTHADNNKTVSEYVVGLVNSIKSWSYMILYKALDHSRTEEEKQGILESYFTELKSIVSKHPRDYVMDYLYYSVLITKE